MYYKYASIHVPTYLLYLLCFPPFRNAPDNLYILGGLAYLSRLGVENRLGPLHDPELLSRRD